MENKTIGIILMALAVLLFLVGSTYIRSAEQSLLSGHQIQEGVCVHEEGLTCPYAQLNELAVPKYLGLFADAVLFLFGFYLFVQKKPSQRALGKARKAAKKLGGDERKVFDILAKSDGMVFQNDLVKQTGFSKVKITRVLDKLEGKKLIERRRRGMTNVIILK